VLPFGPAGPEGRSPGAFVGSSDGQAALHGNWSLYVLVLAMLIFNTVLGEELLFRGFLLPRMRAACGEADWLVNGLLTGLYHLHQPWSMASSAIAGTLFAYPTKRFGSAWMGILVHSAQSIFFGLLVLAVVLK
jgi:membrane protease YdiL (CAAX protease family)